MKISVIIVTYNGKAYIDKLFHSLLKAITPQLNLEVIVVDNGSTDGTPILVEKYKVTLGDKLKIIRLGRNLGFAGGNNAGLLFSSGDIVVLPDRNVSWRRFIKQPLYGDRLVFPLGSAMESEVVAVVVTFNPDLRLLEKCLFSIGKQVRKVIVVDNRSKNADKILTLCERIGCEFVENGFNAGVPYALKRGVEHALRYSPAWILFLDQDSIVHDGAITKVLELYNSLPGRVRARIGIVALGQMGSPHFCKIREVAGYTFSGTLIKAEIVKKITFRINFFLDQADFDLYSRVRECDLKTILVDCKLMEHRIGIPVIIPSLLKLIKLKRFLMIITKKIRTKNLGNIVFPDKITGQISYENPMRYYYIVRNSLILLRERRKNIIAFISDCFRFGLAIIYIDGFTKFMKSFILGLSHGIVKKEGYLENFDV